MSEENTLKEELTAKTESEKEVAIIPKEKGELLSKEEKETAIIQSEKETSLSTQSQKEKKESETNKKNQESKKEQKDSSKEKQENSSEEQEVYDDLLPDLAKLMNVPLMQLKDEFFLFQIRKLMSKLGKLIVRYNISEEEIEKILFNSHALEMGEVVISPAYLPICGRKVRKYRMSELNVNTLIDFPFGENTFKSKMNNVKESVRAGVDGISVMMPNLLATPENIKVFKKQIKKVGRAHKNNSNIVINATDLTEQEIQRVFKLVAKTKLNGVSFAFGEATLEEVKSKLTTVNKLRGIGLPTKKLKRKKKKLASKKLSVIANVDRAFAITELFKLNVDEIITPYADKIGEELVERFKIKSVKLR